MTAREDLGYFSHRASLLRDERLVLSGWDSSYSIHFNRTQGLTAAVQDVDETELRSLLLALRPFVSKRARVYLEGTYEVCDQHISSTDLKAKLRNARGQWTIAQKGAGIRVSINGRDLDPAHVANLWINGWYFHDDVAKERELRQISPLGLSRYLFLEFVGQLLRQVVYVDSVIRFALREGLVTD